MNKNTTKEHQKTNHLLDLLIAIMVVTTGVSTYYHFNNNSNSTLSAIPENTQEVKVLKFGFDTSDNVIDFVKIKSNQFLSDILQYEGISYQKVTEIEKSSKDIYSTRKFKSGKNITFIRPDSCQAPSHFIYQPDVFRYVVFDISGDSIRVNIKEKDFEKCVEVASGKIESSLWNALKANGHSAMLIDKMEDALASQVDFYHTKKGDAFKVIFEQKYIDNKPVAIGNILGAVYSNASGEHYSFYYKNGKFDGYYDYEGRASKGAFLKAPVKYSRISSRFSLARFHPIKKRTVPHYGTDFAAPHGTPIIAVADGVVSKASYTRGNGKFVKLTHSKKYQTQYLHMSRFADGLRVGTHVKQGQCIGYVGSTGLATGPHVCYRFWKDGKQVDPRSVVAPEAKPMEDSELPKFKESRDAIFKLLQGIEYPNTIEPIDIDEKEDVDELDLLNSQT